MARVVAAIDDSAAAVPVLSMTSSLARLLDAEPQAVHVRTDDGGAARLAAERAGIRFRELEGDRLAALTESATASDVALLVVGSRSLPAGRGKAGGLTRKLISALPVPVVVVPPDAQIRADLMRVLVALDGTQETADALAEPIRVFLGHGVEVVVLHVLEPTSVPPFTDQPQHEVAAWSTEFLARQTAQPHSVRLDVRVGMPEHHLLDVAAAEEADLLVLGWTQRLAEGRAVVVKEALMRGRVPILLIPIGVLTGASAPSS